MFKMFRCKISSRLLNQRHSLRLLNQWVSPTKEVLAQRKAKLIEIMIGHLLMTQFLHTQYGNLDLTNYFLILRFEGRLLLGWIQISDFTGQLNYLFVFLFFSHMDIELFIAVWSTKTIPSCELIQRRII